MLYEIVPVVVGKLKLMFHVEKHLKEKLQWVSRLTTELLEPCFRTHQAHAGKMTNDCFFINEEFLRRLVKHPGRSPFNEYNNLFTLGRGSKNLYGTHHMVQLQLGSLYIGVDVAAEQYCKDDTTIAEITVALSYETLEKILMERHGLTESWLKNEVRRDAALLSALSEAPPRDIPKNEEKPAVSEVEVRSSGYHCTIL